MSNLILVCTFCNVWSTQEYSKSESNEQRLQAQLSHINEWRQKDKKLYDGIFDTLRSLNNLPASYTDL